MQVLLLVCLPFNGLDKFEKLFMGMLLITRPGHAVGDHIECGKQGTGPVSFIIMRHGPTAPFLEWQPRLCAIECLDGGLFINAKDDRILGWVQI